MTHVDLKYGSSYFHFEYDADRFRVLSPPGGHRPALTDAEIGELLDRPIDSIPIEEKAASGNKVLFVVPDATRDAGAGQIVNLLVRRLIAAGVEPFNMAAIFATGIHRPVTDDEKSSILTPFIVQRLKTLDHRPRDLTQLVRLGETEGGVPIELNRALLENDHVILVGGVTFHYFAGFTGGRKLICPGLASSRTISGTHKLAFDFERLARRSGVGTAQLAGNAVHEAFVEAASKAPPSYCITSIVDGAGGITDLYCGDWISSHWRACDEYAKLHTVTIDEKRPIVVASCGGAPFDVNLIQAHKAIDAAAAACEDGGTLVVLAKCAEGLGRDDLLRWFEPAGSSGTAEMLREGYQVNGQTAWSLRQKAERFDIRIVTDIHEGKIAQTGMKRYESLAAALKGLNEKTPGFVVPEGAKLRIVGDDARPIS